MSNEFTYRYDFDDFESPYIFKLKLKNGARFKFLNNYYKYYYNPKEHEQTLFCSCFVKSEDKQEAEKSILFSNDVLEYILTAPISCKTVYIYNAKGTVDNGTSCDYVNLSEKSIKRLRYVDNKVLRFKVESELFKEIIGLNRVALSNIINDNKEDSILYYFKIIEKISKKNYEKYYEKNHTKAAKINNKNILREFIKKYFNENFKISMTDDMLNTCTDEIYKVLKTEAYSSIFLKISFFLNLKKVNVDLEDLNKLVKIRNKLAHGDYVEEDELDNSLNTAVYLSNECISSYFFGRKYNGIHLDTTIHEGM